jgi:rod shape-determining protein MreC
MTTEILRKPAVALTTLVLLNILLLSIQARSRDGVMLLKVWGLRVFTPTATAVDWVGSAVKSAAERYLLLYGAAEENRRLRTQNQQLELEVRQLRALQRLYARIPDYELAQQLYSFPTRLAGVVWKGAPFYTQRFVINAGAEHRVVKDAAVLVPQGVVGRVLAAARFSSEVELITNEGAGAGGMMETSGLQGIVQGDGSGLLTWGYIPNYEKVEVGAVVYTSGADGIYPKGIPIGRVIKSETGAGVFRDIKLEPLVDSSRVEEVLVTVKP